MQLLTDSHVCLVARISGRLFGDTDTTGSSPLNTLRVGLQLCLWRHAATRGQFDDASHVDFPVYSSRYASRCALLVSQDQLCSLSDDDDDLDEDAIPGFAHPTIGDDSPRSATFDKGKGRATDQLATPTSAAGNARAPTLSGNIGSAPSGAPSSARRTIGGVQVENRYVIIIAKVGLAP